MFSVQKQKSKRKEILTLQRLACQATVSLIELHSQSPIMLHRDVKSKNFWVSTDFQILKLMDVGFAKFITIVSAQPKGQPSILIPPPPPIPPFYLFMFTLFFILPACFSNNFLRNWSTKVGSS